MTAQNGAPCCRAPSARHYISSVSSESRSSRASRPIPKDTHPPLTPERHSYSVCTSCVSVPVPVAVVGGLTVGFGVLRVSQQCCALSRRWLRSARWPASPAGTRRVQGGRGDRWQSHWGTLQNLKLPRRQVRYWISSSRNAREADEFSVTLSTTRAARVPPTWPEREAITSM